MPEACMTSWSSIFLSQHAQASPQEKIQFRLIDQNCRDCRSVTTGCDILDDDI